MLHSFFWAPVNVLLGLVVLLYSVVSMCMFLLLFEQINDDDDNNGKIKSVKFEDEILIEKNRENAKDFPPEKC